MCVCVTEREREREKWYSLLLWVLVQDSKELTASILKFILLLSFRTNICTTQCHVTGDRRIGLLSPSEAQWLLYVPSSNVLINKRTIQLQAWTGPEGYRGLSLPFSRHKDGKVVSPTHRPPLPFRKYSWDSFLLEVESTPRPKCGREDYVNEKYQLTPSGIDLATFRHVAQFLNQLRDPL